MMILIAIPTAHRLHCMFHKKLKKPNFVCQYPNRQDTKPICQQHLSLGKKILGCPNKTTVLDEH